MALATKIHYKSRNADAGVRSFEILPDAILLEFADRKWRYLYNAEKPGRTHVDNMKRLALTGKGLTTYVNQHVRENYAARLPLDD